ncbi:hypothetical protein MMC14_001772 [Varicellaria rhodocarpa]|nr:hypothetical protein [Varicellaria rhodocarpa]
MKTAFGLHVLVVLQSTILGSALPSFPSRRASSTDTTTNGMSYGLKNANSVSTVTEHLHTLQLTHKEPRLGHAHRNNELRLLNPRARFPLRTKVTIINVHRNAAAVAMLLTRAWDWAVDTNVHDPTHQSTPLRTGLQAAFIFSYSGYSIEINVMPAQSVLLTDVMQILASAHDQMSEGLGFGSAYLDVLNGNAVVAYGYIKRFTGLVTYGIHYSESRRRSLPGISAVANPSAMNVEMPFRSPFNKTEHPMLARLRRIILSSIPKTALRFFKTVISFFIQLTGGEARKWLPDRFYSAPTGIHSLFTDPPQTYTLIPAASSNNIDPASHQPRNPPGIPSLPGPLPESIGVTVVDGIMVNVARRIIQQLLSRAWTLIFEQCHCDPHGLLPEDGFGQRTGGYSFTLLPRERVFMTWTVVYEAFQLIEALQSAGGYGLARMDVHNGNRVIGVVYVSESPGRG